MSYVKKKIDFHKSVVTLKYSSGYGYQIIKTTVLFLFIFINEFNYIVNVFILFPIHERGQQQLTDMLYSFHCYTYMCLNL